MALLELRGVTKEFVVDGGLTKKLMGSEKKLTAVDDISFEIDDGETYGLVGESGAGKSTVANLVVRTHEPTAGTIVFDGTDISYLMSEKLREFRQSVQMVFQTPSASIDPRYSVGDWIEESLVVHTRMDGEERKEQVAELLETVGLSREYYDHYPDELSGGQLQRVSIATAMAVDPELIVLDEPVSALDKSVQMRILNLLSELQDDHGVSYLLISHDLRVVRSLSDRLGVMYLGEIVEQGTAERIFENPRHPYTELLIDSMPPRNDEDLANRLDGEPPSAIDPPSGCRFHPRCPYDTSKCQTDAPDPQQVDDGHLSACHHWEDLD